MADWRDGYRAAVGEYLKAHGRFVELSKYPREEWNYSEPDPEDYGDRDTLYSWADYSHMADQRPWGGDAACSIISVDMESMRERSLMQFQGTFTSNTNEAGVEVRATCACGKYENKWLRWEGTTGEILPALLAGTE